MLQTKKYRNTKKNTHRHKNAVGIDMCVGRLDPTLFPSARYCLLCSYSHALSHGKRNPVLVLFRDLPKEVPTRGNRGGRPPSHPTTHCRCVCVACRVQICIKKNKCFRSFFFLLLFARFLIFLFSFVFQLSRKKLEAARILLLFALHSTFVLIVFFGCIELQEETRRKGRETKGKREGRGGEERKQTTATTTTTR